jgi:hypothetical protein
MRCSPIGIGRNAYFMIHFARVTLKNSLTAEDLDIAAKKMRQTERELMNEYRPRWQGSTKELIAALDSESEFTGHEAVSSGLPPDHTDATNIDRFVAALNIRAVAANATIERLRFEQLRAKLVDVLELEGL